MALFLSEFVPEAPNTRPTAAIAFTHSTVPQNEDEFARSSTLVDAPVPFPCLRFLKIRLIETASLCPNLKFISTTT